MITLLTCTGDRPELLARQERWMARQSLPWTNWIVVDDGVRETPCRLGQRRVRRPPERSPCRSFAANLRTGLEELASFPDSRFVFVIEDDDWYGPDYLASLVIGLFDHELSGESHAPFYHVAERSYRVCGNDDYAALCATSFRTSLVSRILPLIDPDDPELDFRIWHEIDCSRHLQRTRHCVGLKGQRGRPGLGSGHRPEHNTPDPGGMMLRRWIGKDADDVLAGPEVEPNAVPGPRAAIAPSVGFRIGPDTL